MIARGGTQLVVRARGSKVCPEGSSRGRRRRAEETREVEGLTLCLQSRMIVDKFPPGLLIVASY